MDKLPFSGIADCLSQRISKRFSRRAAVLQHDCDDRSQHHRHQYLRMVGQIPKNVRMGRTTPNRQNVQTSDEFG